MSMREQLRATDGLECPECDSDLSRETDGIAGRLAKLGYFKMDARLRCQECGFRSVHDIPSKEDEEKSLERKYIGIGESEGDEIAEQIEPPECPFHEREMVVAHVNDHDHLKFKCPECFMIKTKEVE